MPHPTIEKSIKMTKERLETAGFEVEILPPKKNIRGYGDFLISIPEKSKVAKVRVKGHGDKNNPCWFSITFFKEDIEIAEREKLEYDEAWRINVNRYDFFILCSVPLEKIWLFTPSEITELIELNFKKYNWKKERKVRRKVEMNFEIDVDSVQLSTCDSYNRNLIDEFNDFRALRDWFSVLKMEDLSNLEKLLPVLMLNLVFTQGDKDISRRTALARKLLIRLLDKALYEYNEARKMIKYQIAESQKDDKEKMENGRHIYLHKFIDHIENCICTVRRILRFLNILKGDKNSFAFPRVIRKQIENLTSPIVELRNNIEHMDETIRKDAIQEDESIMLRISDSQDGIIIGRQSLKFVALSTLIKKLHEIGQTLASWRSVSH